MTESTAVTVQERDEFVGVLPPNIRSALALRKQMNKVAATIAGQNWGKVLDHETRRAIAAFGQQYGVDVVTEIYVLGNNVYLNAAFYLRRLGEMIEAGKIVYAYKDMIHSDPRLEKLAAAGNEDAKKESARRAFERIVHDVDENAVSACVFRIMPKGLDREITGVKSVYADAKDPVGNAFPAETVETRAARRAMRQLASHIPAVSQDILAIEASAERLSGTVAAYRAKLAARSPDELEPDPVVHQLGGGVTLKPGGGGRPLVSDEPPKPVEAPADEMAAALERSRRHIARMPARPLDDEAQTAEDRELDLRLASEDEEGRADE